MCRGGALLSKAGPPAAGENSDLSYHHQDTVSQFGKIQLALRCYQRIRTGMSVIAVVLYTKQPFIGWLYIGQYIAGRSAVHKTLFQKKSDKAAFRYIKLFGSSSEIGAMLQINEQVIESGFTLQLCVCYAQRYILLSLSQKIRAELEQRLR